MFVLRANRHRLAQFVPGVCSRTFTTSKPLASFKIYTKTGDKGTSAVFTGERRPKNDPVFDALGATDELSSHIALAKEFALDSSKLARNSCVDRLNRVQCVLQDIGSLIATPKSSARDSHLNRVQFSTSELVQELEEWIDEYTAALPELKNFILPGGGKCGAALHVARTVCRRAERAVAPLVASGETEREALVYLNRLSDFLFTAARHVAQEEGKEETIYIRPQANKTKKDSGN